MNFIFQELSFIDGSEPSNHHLPTGLEDNFTALAILAVSKGTRSQAKTFWCPILQFLNIQVDQQSVRI